MIQHTFHVLEFYNLLNILSGFASCPLGQTKCSALIPSTDLHSIEKELQLVSEMRLLLQAKGFPSFEGVIDITAILKQSLVTGAYIEPEGLLHIHRTLEVGWKAKQFIGANQSLVPGLFLLVKEMPLCEEIRTQIKKAIRPNGSIDDAVSPQLRRIRRKKAELRTVLQKKLEDIKKSHDTSSGREDFLITLRDGRYVIPLKTELKNRLEGIIHDFSHSQATCFFEPIEVIQDNNHLAELAHLEKEEELNILRELTSLVKASAEMVSQVQDLLGRCDELYGKGRLSDVLHSTRPIMGREGIVELRQARNPILSLIARDGDTPVPVDILLDKATNILIISGPNRGGKTVTLKTLGLLSLMAQCGLHIPAAEGCQLPVFRNIMAEIGDDQNIQIGLSTFSAHVGHLKYMLEHADDQSLVLIDEPGMGTDPDEGSALAMAVLDDLASQNALIAVSTHYNRLKTYGLLHGRAKNASVAFDSHSNRPTFALCYGAPGTSYAFEIARDTGLKPDLIHRARTYLDQDEIRLNRLIDRLHRLTQELEEEKARAEDARTKYEGAREKIFEGLKKRESDKKAFMERKRIEADHLFHEAREEIKKVINFLKLKEFTPAQSREAVDQVSANLLLGLWGKDTSAEAIRIDRFRPGQQVRLINHEQVGVVQSIDPYHARATVMAGNVRLAVDLKDLDIIDSDQGNREKRPQENLSLHVSAPSSRELNVIGYHVGDALPLVDRMIDRAIVEGSASLRIIHGYGTGRLKEAIRDHLKHYACVKRISGADPQSGGEAITLVDLK